MVFSLCDSFSSIVIAFCNQEKSTRKKNSSNCKCLILFHLSQFPQKNKRHIAHNNLHILSIKLQLLLFSFQRKSCHTHVDKQKNDSSWEFLGEEQKGIRFVSCILLPKQARMPRSSFTLCLRTERICFYSTNLI